MWISEGTMARTLQYRFGRAGLCILTATPVRASSAQLLERYQVKTTLAIMVHLIPSSAAHRQTTLLLSGGLELILKSSHKTRNSGIGGLFQDEGAFSLHCLIS